MFYGLEQIVIKRTQSDEFGIYRQDSDKKLWLMVACNTAESALKYGAAFAEVTEVEFVNKLTVSDMQIKEVEEKENETSRFTSVILDKPVKEPTYDAPAKRTRITGVEPKIQAYIVAGLDDSAIIAALLPLYANNGKTEQQNRKYLGIYVPNMRKKFSKVA
jgi:hypothetical protein